MRNFQITIGLVAVILAFTFTWLIRSNAINVNTDTVRQRLDKVQMDLANQQADNVALMQANGELKDQLQKAAQTNDYAKGLADMLKKAEMLAGLTDLQGPGVIVTLNDNTGSGSTSTNTTPSFDLIHDQDILEVINDLRASGAEAISLNDERILATTQIRCAGPTVMVNNKQTGTPFIIRAIGDPQTMASALSMPHGVQETLRTFGLVCDIQASDNLIIKGYTGIINNQYAVPVVKEGAAQ